MSSTRSGTRSPNLNFTPLTWAQRAWIAERNYCGYNEDCVKASYHRHIVDLCARATELGLDTCADADNAAHAVAAVPTGKCKVTDPSSTALTIDPAQTAQKLAPF